MKEIKIIFDGIRGIFPNNEITYVIGKNAQDNFNIIDNSKPNDIWFHLDENPSCHVIALISDNIDRLNKKELNKIIKRGALICKDNSKCKSDTNINVVYTFIKNVKKTEKIGTVVTSGVKGIII